MEEMNVLYRILIAQVRGQKSLTLTYKDYPILRTLYDYSPSRLHKVLTDVGIKIVPEVGPNATAVNQIYFEFPKPKGCDFERVSRYPDAKLPKAGTAHSAGYDLYAAEETTIKPIWCYLPYFLDKSLSQDQLDELLRPTMVPTGVKAYMEEDMYCKVLGTSGIGTKLKLIMALGAGIVDSDYYNCEAYDDLGVIKPTHEGHIMVPYWNFGFKPVTFKHGDKVGQAIFTRFIKTNSNLRDYKKRSGGYGSTDK